MDFRWNDWNLKHAVKHGVAMKAAAREDEQFH